MFSFLAIFWIFVCVGGVGVELKLQKKGQVISLAIRAGKRPTSRGR